MNWQFLLQYFQSDILPYVIKFAIALVVFAIGLWVAKVIKRFVSHALKIRKADYTVQRFMGHLVYALIIVLMAIVVLSTMGVNTNSLIAVLGAAFFAVALSLKNSLSSLASGILLIVFRPFKVGDYIRVNGFEGTVEEVQLMFTQVTTGDNQAIFIPNDKLTSNEVVNIWRFPLRRNDLIIGVDYNSDLKKVKTVLMDVLQDEPRVIKDPNAPLVGIQALADSSVNMVMRYWSKREDFTQLQFDLREAVKLRFDAEGIDIPFPQTVLHIKNSGEVKL